MTHSKFFNLEESFEHIWLHNELYGVCFSGFEKANKLPSDATDQNISVQYDSRYHPCQLVTSFWTALPNMLLSHCSRGGGL